MNRFSIHIGINRVNPAHYGTTFPVLRGAVNDATAMKLALQPFGYAEQILLDDTNPTTANFATTTNLQNHLNRFASQLVAGDLLVITYAGHGSQITDPHHVEPDGLNEVFAFWDRFLIDDELRRLFTRFASGVQIVVISDSCNSGTTIEFFLAGDFENSTINSLVGRNIVPHTIERRRPTNKPNEWEQSRLVSFQKAMQVVARNMAIYGPVITLPPLPESALRATVLSLSACTDNQEAHERPDGQHGWFTFRLLNIISNSLPATYPALRQLLETQTAPNGQTPQLKIDGPNKQKLANRRPFS